MAFSNDKKASGPFGNIKYQAHAVNFDAVTTGTVKTGFDQVYHVSFTNNVTEAAGLVTVSGGDVTVASVTASDTGTLLVYGV